MRILIVTQYFWPENFRINDLASDFANKGHEVTVLTGSPNYPEGDLYPEFAADPGRFSKYQSVKILRIAHVLRGQSKVRLMLNYLTFFINASLTGAWKLRRSEFDVIFVFAVSPITMAIPAIVLGRLKHIPIFLWVQDLWPETLSAVGVVRSPFLLKMVGKMVSWIYAKCDHILIQSRAFTASVQQYCDQAHLPGKVLYFPNWAEQVFSQTSYHKQDVLKRDDELFTILFAGNIGDAQDFPAILNAAELLKSNERIRWVIVGDGRARDWVADEVVRRGLQSCVHLVGRFSLETMPSFFQVADALLVALKSDDIFSHTVPGKVQSYLAAGKAILGMIDGEARLVIDESGGGRSCASGASAELAQLVMEMSATSKEDLAQMGERGRQYYQRHFDRETLLKKLEMYFQAAKAGQIPLDNTVLYPHE
ncbi:glycosyltransferase family 4 protein [Solimicrobium silvestre]|uniref:Glycosyl transferase 4-like domain n=1 Tax=Solimicrobium silvestre TaxID=2099400 RepID=A0A2S9GYC3_9BURK|nr:glycosyltransferase family 4 protein [Solimicrobium silvestre]PRC92711.1 Glycosyl transferase 4-like domain [Solimicrobium silvestre]